MIAIIGILFVVLTPKLGFAGNKAKEVGVRNDFNSFRTAVYSDIIMHSDIPFIDIINKELDEDCKLQKFIEMSVYGMM